MGRASYTNVFIRGKVNATTVTTPPVADFSASAVSGTLPLTVNFTDTSTNAPTSWAWDFTNDGNTDSTSQNPSYTYSTAGTYSVKLISTNAGGSSTTIKSNLVTVTSPVSGYSVYFDGDGDYITTASSSQLGFDTGDFTVECWVYFKSTSNYQLLAMLGDGIDAVPVQRLCSWSLYLGDGGLNFHRYTPSFTGASFSWSPTVDQWYHVTVTRSGSSLRAFVNGTQIGSTLTNSTNYSVVNQTPLHVGRFIASGGRSYFLNGYISNLRVIKGTALYTANFTPPATSLSAVAGTSLLTFQSANIVDNSTNNFTVTASGNSVSSPVNPFTN